jgi:hypothetical protein
MSQTKRARATGQQSNRATEQQGNRATVFIEALHIVNLTQGDNIQKELI